MADGLILMRDYVTLSTRAAENKRYVFECKDSKSESGHSLYIKTEATHAGIITGNLKFYRPDRMQDSCHTWTTKGKPRKPVLLNHDKTGACVGRVHKARYVDMSYQYVSEQPGVKSLVFYDSQSKKRLNLFESVDWVVQNLHARPDYKGLGYIELDMNVTEPEAIRKVLSDEFLTVSVSFATNAGICSVCHTDWATEDRCEHELGQSYGAKKMFLITGDFFYRECSFVNFPADPWAQVTNKDAVRQVADSIANRVFFLGLPVERRQIILNAADGLIGDDFLGSDIQPATDEDIEDEDMDLKALLDEIKSEALTKERALAIRGELGDAEDKKAVKRALSSLNARIRANGWAEDSASPTREQVEAKIASIADVLATLADDAKPNYVRQLADEAAAFGIEFKAPEVETPVVQDPTPGATEGQTDAAAPEVPAVDDKTKGDAPVLSDSVTKLFEGEDAAKMPNKDKILKHLEATQTLYGALENDDEKGRYRSALGAMLQVFDAESWLAYIKTRITEAGDAVVSQKELDTLHDAVDSYETTLKQLEGDKAALLKTNTVLVKDHKRLLATVVVAGAVMSGEKGFTGLGADQIQAEIERRSQRTLNSLQDSLEDVKSKLPGFEAPKADAAKPDEVANDVSDNATAKEKGEPGPAAPPTEDAQSDNPVRTPLARIYGSKQARMIEARNRFANKAKEKE